MGQALVNSVSFNAVRLGIDVQDLEITVRSNVDPRVLFAIKGPEQHGPCLGAVEYDVKVKGNISDEELDTIRQLCEHSPVYGLLVEAIPLVANVTRG